MKNRYFYNKKNNAFYLTEYHGEGYFIINNDEFIVDENGPVKDSVEITEDSYKELMSNQSLGMEIDSDEDGKPYNKPIKVKTLEERIADVEQNRQYAYANPLTGSDRLFAEAQRMQLMGQAGWEAIRDKAIARYNEIKEQKPYPTE
jgi:hypothetical protein